MQPHGAGEGPLNESLLFHSLKLYLDNKSRQQPIIGLDSVIECVKVGSGHQETLYLCEVCQSRMKRMDVRNHITGSLHRYCYIKARHPELAIGWDQTLEVSELAWPLMEMASVLEKREGPGVVQVLHLDAIAFNETGQISAASAVSRLAAVRREQARNTTPRQSELTPARPESGTVQPPPRRVWLTQRKRPAESGNGAVAQRQRPDGRSQRTVGVVERTGVDATSLASPGGRSGEPGVQSESGRHVLDGHTVIGLDCVAECRRKGGGGGGGGCFLCHCCRVKSDPGNVIDHLTSPSHISNYLMEVYPECVDAMMGDLGGEKELLQSVALRVAHIEGRGEHEVFEWPAHLCDQLSDKTYHWCAKLLSGGKKWRSAARRENTVGFKGLEPAARAPREGAEGGSERAAKKCRAGPETSPVFKVSVPMSKGVFVLERASFTLPNSPAAGMPSCPPPDPDPDPPAQNSNLDLAPLTVTLFSPPRHIEVRCTDRGGRGGEGVSGWGGGGTETCQQSPSYDSPCGPPYPEERLCRAPGGQTPPGRRHPAHPPGAARQAARQAARRAACRAARRAEGLAEAAGATRKTLSSSAVHVSRDHESGKSGVRQKPADTFYYCTPNGQRWP